MLERIRRSVGCGTRETRGRDHGPDPRGHTGGVQFTQLDPIGLAGGLNLYGFAGGDPVNFSDPFGLNPLVRLSLWWLTRGAPATASVGAALTGLSSPLAPGGGLLAHEARGGHTVARHVARGIVDLSARLESESGLSAASSFLSRAAAERGVASAIAQKSDEIGSWLSGSASRLVIDGDLAEGLGHVLKRGEQMTEAANGVRLVLDRAPGTELGYIIKTAYPTAK
jgi:uncharacterized protein RhaS with RHS repeats